MFHFIVIEFSCFELQHRAVDVIFHSNVLFSLDTFFLIVVFHSIFLHFLQFLLVFFFSLRYIHCHTVTIKPFMFFFSSSVCSLYFFIFLLYCRLSIWERNFSTSCLVIFCPTNGTMRDITCIFAVSCLISPNEPYKMVTPKTKYKIKENEMV